MKEYKLIILDRDGVINQDSLNYVKSPEEWEAIPSSLDAIAKLNKAGYKVVVATNQSGINRKLFTQSTLDNIHNKMHDQLKAVDGKIDKIFVCPHIPEDECKCRKPKPGLLYQIAQHYHIQLKNIYMVGDTLKDVEAAMAAGAKPILLLSGCHSYEEIENIRSVPIFKNLASFVHDLLQWD